MTNVIAMLNEERARVAHRLAALDAAIKALTSSTTRKSQGRKAGFTMSAEARAKISKAVKARWAKMKK